MCIELKNVSKYYGDKKIIEIKDLKIADNEKVGIVGQNGSGKTTLLNIISGKIMPDTGNIIVNQKVIYLEQFEEINKENEYLSGGERKRKIINQHIFQQGAILLADEPSSNLDIKRIKELEKNLKKYKGAILLISHDRHLLDQVCDYIIEIRNGKVKKYKGNYTEFFKQRQLELDRQEFEYMQYIKQKEDLKKAINIAQNSSKTMRKTPRRMGNSEARLHKRGVENKREKLEGHTKALQTRLEKLDKKDKPDQNSQIYIHVRNNEKNKNIKIVEVDNLNIILGNKVIFKNANCVINSTSKVALIGDNGTGKSTFIKELISRKNDNIKISMNANIGYFSQNFETLNFNKTVFNNVINDSTKSERIVKNVLANLLFKEKDLEKMCYELSRGRKSKISSCKSFII